MDVNYERQVAIAYLALGAMRDLEPGDDELPALRAARLALREKLDAMKKKKSAPEQEGQSRNQLLALAASGGHRPQSRDVARWKFDNETLLCRVLKAAGPRRAIEEFIGDPITDVITLEDLPRYRRDAIAAIAGVGPKTMVELDEALAEGGLEWGSTSAPTLVRVA